MITEFNCFLGDQTLKKGTGTFDSLRLWLYSKRHIAILLITVFSLLSIWGHDFLYEKKGRYFYSVLVSADAELFSDDEVVQGLAGFRSLFYEGLGFAFKAVGAPPTALKPVVFGLYLVYKVLLFGALLLLACRLSRDMWAITLILVWACHPKTADIGAETDVSLFMPMLSHLEVSLILGIIAVFLLLGGSILRFWIVLCISVFIHPLVTVHLVFATAPVLLIRSGLFTKPNLMGLSLFALSSILYLFLMAPTFSPTAEGSLLWETVNDSKHLSPLYYGAVPWLVTASTIALALLSQRRLFKTSLSHRLLTEFVLCGALIGSLLALLSLAFDWPLLTQLQPLRTFLWVHFFSYLLIILAAAKAMRHSSLIGFTLLAVVIFSIINSLWFFAFACLAVVYFVASEISEYVDPARLEKGLKLGFNVLLAAISVAWFYAHSIPLQFVADQKVLAPTAAFFLANFGTMTIPKWRSALLVILLGYSLVTASLHPTIDYGHDTGPDWDTVRIWSRDNTPKTAKFITPPDCGYFRLLSFRTPVSRRMPSLKWVDLPAYLRNKRYADEVAAAHDGKDWDLNTLFCLAQKWDVQYVLTSGSYTSEFVKPIFQAGQYNIFRTPMPSSVSWCTQRSTAVDGSLEFGFSG